MARRTETIALTPASPGTERSLTVFRFGTPGARPKAYVQASLHADELPGGLVAHHLIGLLDRAEVTGEVVVVPAANPVGLGQFVQRNHIGRYDGASGENFNRAWPDIAETVIERVDGRLGADGAANGRVIQAAMAEAAAGLEPRRELDSLRFALIGLAADADVVLDLHCDSEAELYLYVGEDLWPDAADLAAELGAVATLLAIESGGNSFDEAFSVPWWKLKQRFGDEFPIPAGCLSATVELRGKSDVSDRLAERDAAALVRFLQRRGFVAGDPGPAPALVHPASPLTGCDVVRAPVAGIVIYRRELGDIVAAGEVLAEIVDQTADPTAARTPVRSRVDGRLFTRVKDRWAWPGKAIAKVAGAEPLPDRGDYLLED